MDFITVAQQIRTVPYMYSVRTNSRQSECIYDADLLVGENKYTEQQSSCVTLCNTTPHIEVSPLGRVADGVIQIPHPYVRVISSVFCTNTHDKHEKFKCIPVHVHTHKRLNEERATTSFLMPLTQSQVHLARDLTLNAT